MSDSATPPSQAPDLVTAGSGPGAMTDALADFRIYIQTKVPSQIGRSGLGLDVACMVLMGSTHQKVAEWLNSKGLLKVRARAVYQFMRAANKKLTPELRRDLLVYARAKMGVKGVATMDDPDFQFSRITMVDTLMRMVEVLGRRIVTLERRNSVDLDEQKHLLECYKEYRALRKALEEEIRTSEVEAARTKTIKEVSMLALSYIPTTAAQKTFVERIEEYEERAAAPESV